MKEVSIVSWKSVEMQVALPRTQEAGKLQDELSRHNQRFQESLAAQQLKQEDIKRQQVNDLQESAKAEIKDEQKEESESSFSKKQLKSTEKKEKVEPVEHPYLGNQIDYSG